MNFRIDNSLNDIVGKSGKRVVEAIIDGQTEASYLVTLFDKRVKTSKEDLLKSCAGQIDQVQVLFLRMRMLHLVIL